MVKTTPSIAMPSRGGLANRAVKYIPGGTSMDLHKRMAKYRLAQAAEVSLPLKHPKGGAL